MNEIRDANNNRRASAVYISTTSRKQSNAKPLSASQSLFVEKSPSHGSHGGSFSRKGSHSRKSTLGSTLVIKSLEEAPEGDINDISEMTLRQASSDSSGSDDEEEEEDKVVEVKESPKTKNFSLFW